MSTTCAFNMQLTQIDFSKQQQHLQKVSRTFALTIPLLPEALVDYISNAYLLCRIADTIEDEPNVPTNQKVAWLNSFSMFCANEFSDDMQLLLLHKQAIELVTDGTCLPERELLNDLEGVISRTRAFPHKYKMVLARGVSILSNGMAKSLQGLKINTLDDVDFYCYYVAGVVGELLAALFYEYDHTIDKYSLMALSVSFGEGLQLTNILKDRAEDSQRDVSFLPCENGMNAEENAKYYVKLCQGHLCDAVDFICQLPPNEKGIRIFCLLNVVMATSTLKLISKEDLSGNKKLKISRNMVKFLYLICRIVAKNNFLVKGFFKFLSCGVTCKRRNAKELRDKVSCWEKQVY